MHLKSRGGDFQNPVNCVIQNGILMFLDIKWKSIPFYMQLGFARNFNSNQYIQLFAVFHVICLIPFIIIGNDYKYS